MAERKQILYTLRDRDGWINYQCFNRKEAMAWKRMYEKIYAREGYKLTLHRRSYY